MFASLGQWGTDEVTPSQDFGVFTQSHHIRDAIARPEPQAKFPSSNVFAKYSKTQKPRPQQITRIIGDQAMSPHHPYTQYNPAQTIEGMEVQGISDDILIIILLFILIILCVMIYRSVRDLCETMNIMMGMLVK
jgi:hypothetical protein